MTTENTLLPKDEEIQQLNNILYQTYGYDFTDYSPASYLRRLSKIMLNYRIATIPELQTKLVENELFFIEFLEQITVNVTEMFRDSGFYKALRDVVIPQLAGYPMIRIWHAGCSTGEEVYSMAILLKEAGLLEKSLLYATDINQDVLEKAASGAIPLHLIPSYSQKYIESGGLYQLSDYYVPVHGKAVFHDFLRKRMVFSAHNLSIDRSFNEFNIILCRNVLIYFNHNLQSRVVQLFSASLPPLGFLALGTKENIDLSSIDAKFKIFDSKQKIWLKKQQ